MLEALPVVFARSEGAESVIIYSPSSVRDQVYHVVSALLFDDSVLCIPLTITVQDLLGDTGHQEGLRLLLN